MRAKRTRFWAATKSFTNQWPRLGALSQMQMCNWQGVLGSPAGGPNVETMDGQSASEMQKHQLHTVHSETGIERTTKCHVE